MTFKGKDLWQCATLSSGVQVKNFDLDYAMAAQWWGFGSLAQFQELDPDEQAHNVAVYRTTKQIDGVIAADNHRKAAREKAKSGRKTGRNSASR